MDTSTAVLEAEIAKQIGILQSEEGDATSRGRACAILTVLFSRCSDSEVAAVAAAAIHLHNLLEDNDRLVQANACAALTAAAALDDELASSIATASTQKLVALLQACCGEERSDVRLNVVSALGQLARDQEATAQALMEPQALACLLLMADAQQPTKLQEAATDSLCALASHEWAREQLCTAGAVPAVAALLNVQQPEVSVRCLMVLGMLLPAIPATAQQLADNAAALQQLMALLKQNEDMDCKIIARDVLGVLMKDETLRGRVEAAIRTGQEQASQQQQHQEQQQEQEAAGQQP